jgi:two-component system, OmpR family, KDP operon response regulator KdpE
VEYRSELEYLRTYILQLRKKLEDDPAQPKYPLTDPHYGYRFADLAEDCKGQTYTGTAA